jgi:hypothetical protein
MKTSLMILACLLLTSCGLLSPEQQQTALQTVDAMFSQGTITSVQAEALRQAILSGGQSAWWHDVGQVVLGAAMGYLGVQAAPGRAATLAAKKATVAVMSQGKS